MSITDLCGSLKSFSDLKKHAIKVRFTESTEVKAGGWFRLTLSRHSDASGPYFLDCRKVFLRFKMRIMEAQKVGSTARRRPFFSIESKLSAAVLSS